VAIGDGTGRWYLVNASPDVTLQVETFLRPQMPPALRSSPIAEIFLTNADLDHSLGLLLLREGPRLRVTAPDGARAALEEGLRLGTMLDSFCGVEWLDAPPKWRELAGGLSVRAVPLAESAAPRFASSAPGPHAVGYLFRDDRTGKQAGIFPDVPALDDGLLAELAPCDALFFDGTFWTGDELAHLGISPRTARDMGHVPISGPGGSLAALAKLRRSSCVYLHINNTNPILDPASPERRAVEGAGLRVAEDGMILDL
jgi:pyrroloquinoline quinone biosynthesis protein B